MCPASPLTREMSGDPNVVRHLWTSSAFGYLEHSSGRDDVDGAARKPRHFFFVAACDRCVRCKRSNIAFHRCAAHEVWAASEYGTLRGEIHFPNIRTARIGTAGKMLGIARARTPNGDPSERRPARAALASSRYPRAREMRIVVTAKPSN